jgi:hypothetical protein
MENHYLVDPMNKTQNVKHIASHSLESGYSNEYKDPYTRDSYYNYGEYQPGGINIS